MQDMKISIKQNSRAHDIKTVAMTIECSWLIAFPLNSSNKHLQNVLVIRSREYVW